MPLTEPSSETDEIPQQVLAADLVLQLTGEVEGGAE